MGRGAQRPARPGYDIRWTLGTVADEPTVTGGYVLAAEDATNKDARERLDEKPQRANGDGAAIVPRSPDRGRKPTRPAPTPPDVYTYAPPTGSIDL